MARSKWALGPRLFVRCPGNVVMAVGRRTSDARAAVQTRCRCRPNNAVGDRLSSPPGLHGRPLEAQDAL